MDDLAGLSWNPSDKQQRQPQQHQPSRPTGQANYFPNLRSTPPVSGRSTPSVPAPAPPQARPNASSSNTPSKPSTPAPDSFASLLPQFGAAGAANKNLSLQEQQKRLQEQKLGQAQAASKSWDADLSALESFGSGRSGTPVGGTQSRAAFASHPQGSSKVEESTEDILAAFGKNAPVDKSSHFPVPGGSRPGSTQPAGSRKHTPAPAPVPASDMSFPDDDDDPFGLGSMPSKPSGGLPQRDPVPEPDEDDDVLGLLGKPVSELPPPREPQPVSEIDAAVQESAHPQGKAVAELVDMGFSVEKAREALETTSSGLDVQAAVAWILNQAHAESRSKTQTPSSGDNQRAGSRPRLARTTSSREDQSGPAWTRRQDGSDSKPRRGDSRSPASGEKDASKVAAELGSNFLKTANSFWKSSTKAINKAVAEFNAEGDASQPKWMRDAMTPEQAPSRAPRQPRDVNGTQRSSAPSKQKAPELLDMTDEAMMLESGSGRPQPKQKRPQTREEPRARQPTTSSRMPPFVEQRPIQEPASRSRMRQALEDDSAQAYVSPARRKKATPKPPSPESDLLFGDKVTSQAPTAPSKPPARSRSQPQTRPKVSTPIPTRPKAPPRNVPQISSIALQSSTQHRQTGNAAFKLGNYSSATASYTSSLQALPTNHPIAILLLTNRALTNLKTGDPKACVADADAALALIGPARGEGEAIDTGSTDEGKKDMAPFWAKAAARRAEGLEQLERWADALAAWKTCVEAGVGGAQAIQARNRCERAANGPAAAAAKKPAASASRPVPRAKTAPPSASAALAGVGSGFDSEAVKRMREANAAAERADDERFRLADGVDARLGAWRKGKEGNLRALLGSLDAVLWEGSGWRKIGMAELVLPGKVKIAYMKGIAKVHPDKLPQSASTEQVMISQAVFSTLNEAWDKFKAENGL